MNPDRFREIVHKAFDGMAADAVRGGYGFDYSGPVEHEFSDAAAFRSWCLDGATGEQIRRWRREPWTAEESAIVAEEGAAEYGRLRELWPARPPGRAGAAEVTPVSGEVAVKLQERTGR
jgi:hypothetical protein